MPCSLAKFGETSQMWACLEKGEPRKWVVSFWFTFKATFKRVPPRSAQAVSQFRHGEVTSQARRVRLETAHSPARE